jgi:hypothetical protein
VDELIRQELPIQSVYERGQDCTATVPVHLEILKLPESVRMDLSIIVDAKDAVRDWYNKDMEYYLKILEEDGEMPPHLRKNMVMKMTLPKLMKKEGLQK